MPSGYSDASPSQAKPAKGLKNDDGRLKGKVESPALNDKPVDSMPNEGAPKLASSKPSGSELI